MRRRAGAVIAWAALCAPAVGQTYFIGQNFTGSNSSQTPYIPPDTMGAVGVDSFTEFINGRMAIYRKSDGALLSGMTDSSFWTNKAGVNLAGASLSDPRIIYDHLSQRWFASEIDLPSPAGSVSNNFLLAVSQTSDPTGNWTGFKIDADSTNAIFADFPTLGVNAAGVYLASNNFAVGGNQSFQNVDVLSIPKADLLAATPTVANRTLFERKKATDGGGGHGTPGLGYAIQPTISFDSGGTNETLLAVSASFFSRINRTTVQNPGAAGATLSSSTAITSSISTSNPPLAHQPDGITDLDASDYRIASAVYQVGNILWSAHGISSNNRDAIRWEKIDATTNGIIQAGTISDSNADYIYPSICANSNGDVVIGFTRSSGSAGGYPSDYAVVGGTSGSTTTFGTPFLLQQGLGNYHEDKGSGQVRWGDYSATTPDPADPQIFWTIQEWSSQVDTVGSKGKWSTQVSEIIIPRGGEVRWAAASNGLYNLGLNWLGGSAPTSGSHAIFSRASDPAGSGYTVTLLGDATNDRLSVRQGKVTLDLGGGSYTLANTSNTAPSVVIGEFGGDPTLTVTNGTLESVHTFIAPGSTSAGKVIVNGANWNSSGSLYVGGSNTNAGGPGELVISSGAVHIVETLKVWTSGQVTLGAGGAALVRTGDLSIDGNGQVDLADGKMIVDYTGTSPVATIRQYLINGRGAIGVANGETWSGTGGIASSVAAATDPISLAVGYREATDPQASIDPVTVFAAENVDDTAILIRYTYVGDANLDGNVDRDDLNILSNSFGQTTDVDWMHGDFDYNGTCDRDDLNLLASSFGSTPIPAGSLVALYGASFAGSFEQAAGWAAVPEPGGTALLVLGALILRRGRRII